MLGAVTLGLWADGVSSERGIIRWFEGHPPPAGAWQVAFAARGLREVSAPKSLDRARRALPSMADDAGSAWIAAEKGWAALYDGGDSDGGARIFAPAAETSSLGKPPPPQAWEPAGQGWLGLIAVLEGLHPPAARPPRPSAPQRPLPDRRQISY